MVKQKQLPISDERAMVDAWRDSALAEQRHRREDCEKMHFEYSAKDKRMDEWTSGIMRAEGICPCRKHKGVVFMNNGRLNPTPLCPAAVWLFWSKRASANGTWKTFLEETPFESMMENFKLGGKNG
jgi:hypothetical protein